MSRSEFSKRLNDLGFSLDAGENESRIKGRLGAALSFASEFKNLPWNHNDGKHYLYDDARKKFSGGTYGDLLQEQSGRIDMRIFQQERRKLESSDLMKKIRASTEHLVPKRTRFMSEHDGEWDFGRRFEITPFSTSRRKLVPGRTIEVCCNFSINCAAGSREIDRYGAMAWAIADVIEKAGIMTRITWWMKAQNLASGLNAKVVLELKKPGEYVTPSLLASAFKSNFYRRVGFGLYVACAELASKAAYSSLGYPSQEDYAIKFDQGVLRLSPRVSTAYDSEIEAEILKAVGVFKQRGAA